MTPGRDAYHQLAHLYAGAAAVCRGDEFAVRFLRGTETGRRQMLQAAVQITAQALRFYGQSIEPDKLAALVSDRARLELFDAAVAHLYGDRLTGFETVERLARVQRSVTDIAAPLIAEIWTFAATAKGQPADEYARQLCLAAGMVGASLEE